MKIEQRLQFFVITKVTFLFVFLSPVKSINTVQLLSRGVFLEIGYYSAIMFPLNKAPSVLIRGGGLFINMIF